MKLPTVYESQRYFTLLELSKYKGE
jgi:hypothetical protein